MKHNVLVAAVMAVMAAGAAGAVLVTTGCGDESIAGPSAIGTAKKSGPGPVVEEGRGGGSRDRDRDRDKDKRPTTTATATRTATATATSTATPTPTPTPTTPSIFPPIVPGAIYNPDMFKIIAPSVCVLNTNGGPYVDVAWVVTGGEGSDAPGAGVWVMFFDLGGGVVADVDLGAFAHGMGYTRAAWGSGPTPTWVELIATIDGLAYRSDTCAIMTSAY